MASPQNENPLHNKFAPYWAIVFVVLLITGLATIRYDLGFFWQGYVLDIVGPAWTYILIRGLYTAKADNVWTRLFTSNRTFFLLLTVSFGIEALQYFNVYEATFDPWDLLAYSALLLPLYLTDKAIIQKAKKSSGIQEQAKQQ